MMDLQTAIDQVSRRLLRDGIERACWSDYPELGMADWDRVLARATDIAGGHDRTLYAAASALLAARAEAWQQTAAAR